MKMEELKAALDSCRRSMHKIVTDILTHDTAGGLLSDMNGKPVLDGSKVVSFYIFSF
jgi:hypothetical protein